MSENELTGTQSGNSVANAPEDTEFAAGIKNGLVGPDRTIYENETTLTLDLQYKFNIVHTFKRLIMFEILFFIVGGISGAVYYLNGKYETAIAIWIMIGILLIIWPFIFRAILHSKLKRVFRKSPAIQGRVVHFWISENDMRTASFKDGVQDSQSMVRYYEIVKIIEKNNLLMMYITPNSALLLDGANMIKGDFGSLTEFFRLKLGEKYKLRKL